MRVAITIATRNRREDLARTWTELRRLDPAPDEWWICADGCTDDTVTWVKQHAPAARLIEHRESRHSIRSRDEMIRASACDIVVGLDDDSYPLSADFVAHVRRRFAARPKCAVLSFPQRTDEFPDSLTARDFGPSLRVGSYVNAASALRRSTYLGLGGWPLMFEHAYDEPDYALRCIDAGWEVIHDTSQAVRHHWSARMRNEIGIHHRHARNEQWSVLMRCPSPLWPFAALRRAVGQFAYSVRRGPAWIVREPIWWWRALRGAPGAWGQREPVSAQAYRRWRALLQRPEPFELEASRG
jgi:GT2 family glycosyltransferase